MINMDFFFNYKLGAPCKELSVLLYAIFESNKIYR